MLHAAERINGRILWANNHLLFWLSLTPFVTGWLGHNQFAAAPTAAYGVVQLCAAFAYWILQTAILAEHGPHSRLAKAVGRGGKEKLSLVALCRRDRAGVRQPLDLGRHLHHGRGDVADPGQTDRIASERGAGRAGVSRFVGALDQGTTSTRFIVFDGAGREVARRQLEHRQITPRAGWVEHDPIEIAARVDETIAGALRGAGLNGSDLAAIGITNQRETTVVWDPRTGRPWHNAIVWQDTRTDRAVAALEPARELLRARTGLPPATYFSAAKLQWILDHVDGARAAAERGEALFGTIDCWIIWNLTGGPAGGRHVTDATNASRTQLMDLRTLDWDDDHRPARSAVDLGFSPPSTRKRSVASADTRRARRRDRLSGPPRGGRRVPSAEAREVDHAVREPRRHDDDPFLHVLRREARRHLAHSQQLPPSRAAKARR